jgi:large conductance mechanosensitive channel
MSILSEFKAFALRGNVIDLAVGVVVGNAFSAITNSLVANVITPPLGLLVDNVDFSRMGVTLKEAQGAAAPVVLSYGVFLQAVVNFLIIAWVVFLVIKLMNRVFHREAQKPAPKAAPLTKDQALLVEIRDLLKKPKAR